MAKFGIFLHSEGLTTVIEYYDNIKDAKYELEVLADTHCMTIISPNLAISSSDIGGDVSLEVKEI